MPVHVMVLVFSCLVVFDQQLLWVVTHCGILSMESPLHTRILKGCHGLLNTHAMGSVVSRLRQSICVVVKKPCIHVKWERYIAEYYVYHYPLCFKIAKYFYNTFIYEKA